MITILDVNHPLRISAAVPQSAMMSHQHSRLPQWIASFVCSALMDVCTATRALSLSLAACKRKIEDRGQFHSHLNSTPAMW